MGFNETCQKSQLLEQVIDDRDLFEQLPLRSQETIKSALV